MQMNVSYDKTSTLRAQDHGHPPLIVFEPRSQDGVPRIVNCDIAPTLNTCGGGQRQPCIVTTNHYRDDKHKEHNYSK